MAQLGIARNIYGLNDSLEDSFNKICLTTLAVLLHCPHKANCYDQ